MFDIKRARRILLEMLENKDSITAEHCRNVARLSLKLGKACGLNRKELKKLEMGALLHDADKLNVPDEIFDKLRGGIPLTNEDNHILIEHASLNGAIPFEGEMPKVVQDCQRLHHENFDGTGGPKGLKGDQIPFAVRILQVADTYDALTLNLPGHKGQTREDALHSLQRIAGTVLDPEVVDKFVQIMARPISP